MTTKDYQLLARTIKAATVESENHQQAKGVLLLAHLLTIELEADNERFDRDKFKKAYQQ